MVGGGWFILGGGPAIGGGMGGGTLTLKPGNRAELQYLYDVIKPRR